MNESKDDYCDHRWDGGGPARVCLSCGQVRSFPSSPGGNPALLWPGKSCRENPLELPKGSKVLIAQVAKGTGIKKMEKLVSIPMVILRAWVGAYCRAPGSKVGRPRKAVPAPLSVIPSEATPAAPAVFAPPIVRLHGRHKIYQF